MSDTELISEALRWANGHPNRRSSELMRALADALAAVPDAATEARIERWMQLVWKGVEERMDAEAERDAALAAIERVTRAKLEVDSVHQFHGNDCLCGFSSARSRSRTEHITGALLAALDGAPEPEVKP